MTNAQRIYQMDGQLNSIRRQWIWIGKYPFCPVMRCWERLITIAERFENEHKN